MVSLSHNPSLAFDGARVSVLNENVRRKSCGEGSDSAYNIRGRADDMNTMHRCRSKSRGKEKQHNARCYQCGFKGGHKNLEFRYFNMDQEIKKNTRVKKKKWSKKSRCKEKQHNATCYQCGCRGNEKLDFGHFRWTMKARRIQESRRRKRKRLMHLR